MEHRWISAKSLLVHSHAPENRIHGSAAAGKQIIAPWICPRRIESVYHGSPGSVINLSLFQKKIYGITKTAEYRLILSHIQGQILKILQERIRDILQKTDADDPAGEEDGGFFTMESIDLSQYGITGVTEIVHNPSYEDLFKEETKPGLEGYEVGQVTELGAVNVMTGIYTGRSPKDKFIVMDENSRDTVWWTSEEYKNDNHPASEETWKAVKKIAQNELSNKRLFVVDAFCGANPDTRMAVRFIMEVAWQAHFIRNMFIKPTEEELANFKPDFVVYNASKAKVENYKELGLNSETAVVFNITSREQVIINTWYGGEMKKGMFSMMNY